MACNTENYFHRLDSCFQQQLWFTPLSNLNDPFEGCFKLKTFRPTTILSNPKLLSWHLESYRKNGERNLTEEALKTRLCDPVFQKELANIEKNYQKELFHKHGAVCFTDDPNNIPMWAYYANDHQGYCLELELDFGYIQKKCNTSDLTPLFKDIQKGKTLLSFSHTPKRSYKPYEFVFTKVRYAEKIPTVDLNKAIKISSELEKIKFLVARSVGVKFTQWQHEREYRLIANTNSGSLQGNNPLPLKIIAPFLKVTGIILGAKMDGDRISQIERLAHQHKIRLLKATISPNEYKIETQEIKASEEA